MIERWICEKCNKKWIYPIEKCIYCKAPVVTQKGAKIKIIGITKVLIPSPMHPIIPYFVLLLEDEYGNRIPKKTMTKHKIGDEYVEKKAQSKQGVAVVKIKYDLIDSIENSLSLLDEVKFGEEDKILIKPSLVMEAYSYQAVNTNPDFFNAVLTVLVKKGVKKENIIVAEQALLGNDVQRVALKSGILAICKKHEVNVADISKGPFEEIESEGEKFNVYKEALGRKIINLPTMKTNFQIGLSGALENLSRLVDEKTQREMYSNNIDKSLPKLVNALKEVFTIADSVKGMQGQGPLVLGEPAFLNFLMAGRNAAAIDSVFCKITELDIPLHVQNSSSIALNDIEVVGNEIDAMRYPIKKPTKYETPHPDIKVIDGKSNPACLNILYLITSKLLGLRGDEINIVMGSHITKDMIDGKERIVALGDDAYKKICELKTESVAKIDENIDAVEQILFLKKLLTTKGTPKLTPVDKVRTKMKKLLFKVVK
jgi:uncharacterized protein (DUF362 family)